MLDCSLTAAHVLAAAGSSSKGLTPDLGLTGLSDFGSTGLLGGAPLMLNTELPSPSESTWLASPHSPGEADTTLPAYPSPDRCGCGYAGRAGASAGLRGCAPACHLR